jgi:hypothetical protein
MTAINLTREIEAWAEAEVEAGRAESVEAFVIGVLNSCQAETEALRSMLDAARASISRGDGIDGGEFLSELDRWIREDEEVGAHAA